MNKRALFILTGGAIDSNTKGQERDVLLEHSCIPEYFRKFKLDENLEFMFV